MNRFRSRKKAKEAPDGDIPPLPVFPKAFLKPKKGKVESKSEIDLSTALPSTDDFRTSLLMPNLSARFSMLREQDDPKSKIGKANDDSVLFPRRASRLDLFGHSKLTDIDEVSVNNNSARPSFAMGRGSVGSKEGYCTDDDGMGVMTRSRPVESNTLFGGRQKIYKIPVNSASGNDLTSDNGGNNGGNRMPGRHLYENDVTMSAFQRLKEEERRQQEESPTVNSQQTTTTKTDTEALPSTIQTQYNPALNSSTSVNSQSRPSGQDSGPMYSPRSSRSSTAAGKETSTGENIERNPTKSRRLYEQGIELRNQQQPSVLSRLENLSRQRSMANDTTQINRSLSKSAVSLNEKYQKGTPVYTSSNFRPTSPPISTSSSIVGSTDASRGVTPVITPNHNQTSGMVSPLSPPASENGEASAFAAAVQSEDRGKATATGPFSKPSTKSDENHYSQRQVHLHEGGRNTPPLSRPSPSQTPSALETRARSRGLSNTSFQSKAETMGSTYRYSRDESVHVASRSGSVSSGGKVQPTQRGETFLEGLSDSESDVDVDAFRSKTSSNSHTYDGMPSSLRTSIESRNSAASGSANKAAHPISGEIRYSESRDLNTINENETIEPRSSKIDEPAADHDLDSPTLGPSELGLSGLVRTHLRQDSDSSSILSPPSPDLSPKFVEENRRMNPALQDASSIDHAASIHSNPWEYDDCVNNPHAPEKLDLPQAKQPNISSMSMRAKQMLGQANALSGQGQERDHGTNRIDRESLQEPASATAPSREDLRNGHHRGGSSETQMDREEFANELAERRRKVQEKLKSFAANETRSDSPTSGQRFPDYNSPGKPGNAFSMLKSKTGRNQGPMKQDGPHMKHPRVNGTDTPGPNAPSSSLPPNDQWREDEERMLQDFHRQPRTHSPSLGGRPPHSMRQQQMPFVSRRSEDDTQGASRDGASSPWRNGPRDRACSDASGRSKSRPRHREDLESVRENTEHLRARPPPDFNPRSPPSVPPSAKSSMDLNDRVLSTHTSAAAAAGRYRSNSRSGPAGHSDIKPNPIQTGHLPVNPPRPSPATPYSANATPPLFETSPAASPAPTPGFGEPPAMSRSQSRERIQSGLGSHKRAIDKFQISEPKFVSSTSNVPTIGLPPGASLANGTPPIPPMNPRRRRQTTTQTILGAFKSPDKSEPAPMPTSSTGSTPPRVSEEYSTFSDEEKRSRPRQRLRKISSEGGTLNAKARQQLMSASNPSTPALPQYPKHISTVEGGMF